MGEIFLSMVDTIIVALVEIADMSASDLAPLQAINAVTRLSGLRVPANALDNLHRDLRNALDDQVSTQTELMHMAVDMGELKGMMNLAGDARDALKREKNPLWFKFQGFADQVISRVSAWQEGQDTMVTRMLQRAQKARKDAPEFVQQKDKQWSDGVSLASQCLEKLGTLKARWVESRSTLLGARALLTDGEHNEFEHRHFPKKPLLRYK